MATTPSADGIDTRQCIVDCATRLFADTGYDGTSIRDIVEAAGVTKPVLYYYFQNKEDLFRSIVRGLYETFLDELETVLSSGEEYSTRFEGLIRLYLSYTEVEPHTIRLVFTTLYGPRKPFELSGLMEMEDRHIARVVAFIEEGMDSGFLKPCPAEPLVLHLVGAVTSFLQARMLDRPAPGPEMITQIQNMLLNGIGGHNA